MLQYSILGADNAELAVWRGYIMSAPSIPAVQSNTAQAQNPYYSYTSGFAQNIADTCHRSVFMFPEEYSVPLGINERIYFKNTETGGDNWTASLSLTNHLGTDYSEDLDPFGNGITPIRQGFIGCNKDAESGYGDHGVRKYDPEIGRFTAVEPLIDKYHQWNGYQYCMNNPIIAKDFNGNDITYQLNGQTITTIQTSKYNYTYNYKDPNLTLGDGYMANTMTLENFITSCKTVGWGFQVSASYIGIFGGSVTLSFIQFTKGVDAGEGTFVYLTNSTEFGWSIGASAMFFNCRTDDNPNAIDRNSPCGTSFDFGASAFIFGFDYNWGGNSFSDIFGGFSNFYYTAIGFTTPGFGFNFGMGTTTLVNTKKNQPEPLSKEEIQMYKYLEYRSATNPD